MLFLPRNAAMLTTWPNTQLAGGSAPAMLEKYEVFYYFYGIIYDFEVWLNVYVPQNSYVEILTLPRMVLGGGAFRRWLSDESRASVNGLAISFSKRVPESFLVLFLPCVDTMRRQSLKSGRGVSQTLDHAGTLDLRLPACRDVRNKFLMFISHPV